MRVYAVNKFNQSILVVSVFILCREQFECSQRHLLLVALSINGER